MREAIVEFWPEKAGTKPVRNDFETHETVEGLVSRVRSAGIDLKYNSDEPVGKTIAAIFEAVAEGHLMQPTIIYEFPTAVSPLSKQKPDEPDWTERFEMFAGGTVVTIDNFLSITVTADGRTRSEKARTGQ